MTCQTTLEKLRSHFEAWSCSKHDSCAKYELDNRRAGRETRIKFLSKYPFHQRRSEIDRILIDRQSVYDFLVWPVYRVRALGGIRAVIPGPIASRAARNLPWFHHFLSVATNPSTSVADKIDAWDQPGRGGDRLVAKKVAATYFPDQVVPVFNQAHMEGFVAYLGREHDSDTMAQAQYGSEYASLTIGQRFAILNDVLLDSKTHHGYLAQEDNVYLMYCLYAGCARPPEMGAWRGHDRSACTDEEAGSVIGASAETVDSSDQYELETGIRRGQRFHNSKAARRAIELRAMALAKEFYAGEGWSVEDTTKDNPYDLRCTRQGQELRVEVKGTTADGSKVILTRNEVRNAREFDKVALFVVSGVEVTELGGRPVATGGRHKEWNPWAVDQGELDCFQYEYSPPAQ